MGNKRHVPEGGIRGITSMKDLQYHKMRLDLATEFLEDKIEDNIREVKYRLSPKHLFHTILTSLFALIGRRKRRKHDAEGSQDEDDDDDGSGNVFIDGLVGLIKVMFRTV